MIKSHATFKDISDRWIESTHNDPDSIMLTKSIVTYLKVMHTDHKIKKIFRLKTQSLKLPSLNFPIDIPC